MPRVKAIPSMRETTRHIQTAIGREVDVPSNKKLESDPYRWVRSVLRSFPFVGKDFGIFLASFVEENERKLNRKNPDWANGSLFDTISYLPSKRDFSFGTTGITVEDLLVLVAMHTEGIDQMEPRIVKEMTGHTLTRIRQLSEFVSQ